MASVPGDLPREIEKLISLLTINVPKLKQISNHFASELEKGLSVEGGDIPMNPTWVISYPDGSETGNYLTLDIGGTNIHLFQVTLTGHPSTFQVAESDYRIHEEIKTSTADVFWEHVADCLSLFLDEKEIEKDQKLALSLIFSYPVTQNHINSGVLQRWTKGFNVAGVEGRDVVPMFTAALNKRVKCPFQIGNTNRRMWADFISQRLPIDVTVLTNDTIASLIAGVYTDVETRIGLITGTGCNAAYMENCGSIPRLADAGLPADTPMAINCEWGAFDNGLKILPRTKYDVNIDHDSPRPGEQVFEKMVAGLYLGEIFRLVLVDFHDSKNVGIFEGQDISKLRQPYCLDSSNLSAIQEDTTEKLQSICDLFRSEFNLTCGQPERELIRQTSEVVSTRAARLAACGIAAICKKRGYEACHVAASGSLIEKHPRFTPELINALGAILEWPTQTSTAGETPVEIFTPPGNGVGAAVIAALTLRWIQDGNLYGISQLAES